ncbi:hypothetical protein [Peristeroidobacter soli]|uniref:hypothetical protein n=1 Tax=Peristeroidobacter soli TaxID=2497877 RepID=UPI00101BEF7A|nr:hypothetical protein [Peristeroidobacter soli]
MISEPHTRPIQLSLVGVKLAWRAVCVPIYFVLAILEPFIGFLLGALTVLGVLTAIGVKLTLPDAPFWTLLATALGFGVLLAVYYLLMRLFRPQ